MRSNSYPRTSFCGHANNNCGAAADVHGLYLSPARSELRRSRLAATLVTTAGISPQNARKSGGSGERWRPRVPQIPQLCLQTRSFLQRSRLAPAAAAVATSKAALAVAAHAKANQTISAHPRLSSCCPLVRRWPWHRHRQVFCCWSPLRMSLSSPKERAQKYWRPMVRTLSRAPRSM